MGGRLVGSGRSWLLGLKFSGEEGGDRGSYYNERGCNGEGSVPWLWDDFVVVMAIEEVLV